MMPRFWWVRTLHQLPSEIDPFWTNILNPVHLIPRFPLPIFASEHKYLLIELPKHHFMSRQRRQPRARQTDPPICPDSIDQHLRPDLPGLHAPMHHHHIIVDDRSMLFPAAGASRALSQCHSLAVEKSGFVDLVVAAASVDNRHILVLDHGVPVERVTGYICELDYGYRC